MKILNRGVLAAMMILMLASVIHAQDLSKYRNFSFGSSLANVSKQAGQQPAETQVINSSCQRQMRSSPPL